MSRLPDTHTASRHCCRGDGLPPGLPLPSTLQTLAFWRWPHDYLRVCRRRYGPTFTIRATGMEPLVFMSDPRAIKSVVAASSDVLHPGAGAAVIAPLVGELSFMLAEGQQHLAGRKRINPAFHRQAVAAHTAMVREVAEGEIARWPVGEAFRAHPYLRALTLKVILRTLFGCFDERLSALHQALLAMLAITASLALQEPQLRRLPGWRPAWKGFLHHRAHVDWLLRELIADRRAQNGVLAMLLDARGLDGCPLSAHQVRDDLMSLVLAGHETTASALAWSLQLLAHNPAVLNSLTDTLDQGDEAYLAATVQEVLRRRPVFLFTIPRVVRQAIEIGGWTYNPPAQLLGCIHLMHHDPGLYPEPDRFRPERFLEKSPESSHWLPWGGGRKRCPGHHLALLEMQTVLRTLLAHRTLRPAATNMEPARWRSVIVTPASGSRIILNRRASKW
jgi:cytochrome P450 family 135